jgi:hypothetical protein
MGLATAGFAVSAAQGIAGYSASSSQAAETNRNSYLQGVFNNMALAQTYNQLNNQRVNERNSASDALFNDRVKATQVKATATAAADAAGVGGSQSFQNLMQDYAAQEGRIETNVSRNYSAVSDHIQSQAEAAYLGTASRNMSLPRAQSPSPLSLGLRIAGAGLDAVGSYYRQTTQNPYTLTQVTS